jgi:hypothetical protein
MDLFAFLRTDLILVRGHQNMHLMFATAAAGLVVYAVTKYFDTRRYLNYVPMPVRAHELCFEMI